MEDVWKNLGPAVRDGVVRFLSVSQLEAFDPNVYGGCHRRWWFRRVRRVKEGQSKPSELGEKIHSQIEHYLRHGDKSVLGDIALSGLRFLPRPGADLKLEWVFGLPDGDIVRSPLMLAGVPLIGKADCAHERPEWVDNEGEWHLDPDLCEVDDWKTTARINDQVDAAGIVIREGLAKRPDELAKMHQMRAYAALAHMEWPNKSRIMLAHGYFKTTYPRDAEKRYKIVDAAGAQARFLEDEALVLEMQHTATIKNVADIEPNYGACEAYGGCKYKNECPRSPSGILSSLFNIRPYKSDAEERPMGLMEKRRQEKAAAAAPPVDTAVAAEVAKLEAEEKAALNPGSTPVADNPVAPPDEPESHDIARVEPSQVVASGEVGGPCSKGGQQVKLESGSKSFTCGCGAVLRVRPKELADGTYAMVPNHTFGEQPAKAAKAPKAKKTVEESINMLNDPTATDREILDAATNVLDAANLKPEPEKIGTVRLALYLDSAPDHRYPVQRLEEFAESLATELANGVGAADIRCAPDKSSLAFGKWKGALAAVVRENKPTAGMWAVSSTSELGMVAFDALLPFADMVVRPIK